MARLIKLLILTLGAFVAAELPTLNVGGFSWAEQLAFDGLGNMFVSDAVAGELRKIYLCEDGTKYCNDVFLTKGVKQFGGLQITPDGRTIYAGVTLDDKSKALISADTKSRMDNFEIVTVTEHQANGLACDFDEQICYMTDEGTGSEEGGSVSSINLITGTQTVVKDHIPGADGAWLDTTSRILYVGELLTLNIIAFDVSSQPPVLIGTYPGLGEALGKPHMLDDITLFSTTNKQNMNETVLLGSDFTGKAVMKFSLDGKEASAVVPPEGIELKEITSVRWGKGPGFDAQSIYVTEGGGATKLNTERRVLQIKMN
jgi:hypothetical protein